MIWLQINSCIISIEIYKIILHILLCNYVNDIYVSDPVVKVSLASSNLSKSIAYWNGLLSLKIFEKNNKSVLLGFSEDQAKLELVDIGKSQKHE